MKSTKCYVFSDSEAEAIARAYSEDAFVLYEGGNVMVRLPQDPTHVLEDVVDFAYVLSRVKPGLGLSERAASIYEQGNQCFMDDVAVVVVDAINQYENGYC